MGDEHVGEVKLGLQLVEQLQDALGHKLIQRRGDLIANDELRLSCQRPGDADALLLSA